MTTILEPPSAPADRSRPRPVPNNTPLHLSQVVADLLPDEVRDRRRLGRLQRQLAAGGGALVLLIAGGYLWSLHETSAARGALAAEQAQTAQLNARLGTFTSLLQAQAQAQAIRAQVATVMTNDLPWSKLVGTLQHAAPAGVTVSSVSGSVPGPGGTAVSTTVSVGGTSTVGTLTVSGNAPDYREVAAYVSTLGKVPGLTDVNPSTVTQGTTGGHGGVTYTLDLALTDQILGGRFTPPVTTTVPGSVTAPGTTTTTAGGQ